MLMFFHVSHCGLWREYNWVVCGSLKSHLISFMTRCGVGAINHSHVVSTTSTCYKTIKFNNHIVTHAARVKGRHLQWRKIAPNPRM